MDSSDVDIVGSPERNINGSIFRQEDGESSDELEVGDRNTHMYTLFHSILKWLLLSL